MDQRRILLVGPHMQRALALRAAGASVDYMRSVSAVLVDPLDGAVIDQTDPADAAESLARLRDADPALPVVLLAAHPSLAALEGVRVVLPPASGEDILSALPARERAAVPEPRLASESPAAEAIEPSEAAVKVEALRRPGPGGVAALARTARSLTAVAQGLAAALAARLDSDAAVLFRRGSGWQVVAGEGLRPLEWRDLDELPGAMGLLTDDHPTLSVGDSDDLRGQLVGAPLARHHSVLMTRADDLILVLGRPRPYGKPDVQAVLGALREQRDDLATAHELLRLAEALEPHRLG